MPSFPSIQSVLEKARRFRQAGTYLTGKERERFETTHLPFYLDWAKHLFELGLWTESRCLFQEIQAVSDLESPYSVLWEILEQEKKGEITRERYSEIINNLNKNSIQTLQLVHFLMDEGNIVQANQEFERIGEPIKKTLAGQLVELRLKNKDKDLLTLQSMLDSALKADNNGYLQPILILLHRYFESGKLIDQVIAESKLLEDNLIKNYASLKTLKDLSDLPLPNSTLLKIKYSIQRAATIVKDFGTEKHRKEISLLISEIEKWQKELPLLNQKNKLTNQKDNFREILYRNFLAEYEHIGSFIQYDKIYKEIKDVKRLLVRLGTIECLYLPLIFWEIKFEMECLKYLHLRRLEFLLKNEHFIKWCQRQEKYRVLSKIMVFVSYSTLDRAIMKKIVRALEAYGIVTVLDIYELRTRIGIQDTLDNMIRGAQYTLLLVSQNSLTSGWVGEEMAFNLMLERVKNITGKEKKLIPVVIDKTARTNFWYFGNQITTVIGKLKLELRKADRLREDTLSKDGSLDISEEQNRLTSLTTVYDKILKMIKSDFSLDFYDDEKIAENMPKLVEWLLEFNQSSSLKSGKASTSP